MTLKHYFPISVAFFLLVTGLVHYLHVPVLPFALIILVGETLLGFQVEDHKVPRFLRELFKGPASGQKPLR